MKLAVYDKYKDSGIDGIEKIPEHWEVKRIKDIFTLMRGKFTHRPRNDSRLYIGGTFPFIQTGDVSQANKYITTHKQKLNENGIKVSKKFKKNTIVMTIAANIGDVAILGFDTYFPDSIVGFLTKENYHYFYYLLTATKSELDKVKVTNTQDNLNLERLNGLLKIYPPQEEQITIANYLDEKTAQIDKKIQLFEQKIRTYRELKQSLINESVCRGLDKDVPLKDSGVPWIGEIPVHWEIRRVKDFFREAKECTKTGKESLLSVSEYTGITKRIEKIGEGEHLSRADSLVGYKICRKGDVVINIMLAWKGALGVSPYDGIVSPAYGVYRPESTIDPKFYHYLFRDGKYVAEFKRNSTGIIASRLRLYSDNFFKIHLILPPLTEQTEIAEYLDENTQRINAIIANITRQIATLQELKTTLINDVVTGKLKVA